MVLRKSLEQIFSLVFPEKCLGCNKTIEKNKFLPFLCEECFKNLEINSAPFCPLCKKRLPILYLPEKDDFKISPCYHSKKCNLNWLGAATFYENKLIENLINAYKYKFIKKISYTLTAILLLCLEKSLLKKVIQKEEWTILPIPLHPQRKRWRGFNQSELIAQKIAEKLQLPYQENILLRRKKTKEQALLPLKERENNLKGAFLINPKIKNLPKKIILVDDVYTSGTTLKEAATVLKKAGTRKTAGLVFALKSD